MEICIHICISSRHISQFIISNFFYLKFQAQTDSFLIILHLHRLICSNVPQLLFNFCTNKFSFFKLRNNVKECCFCWKRCAFPIRRLLRSSVDGLRSSLTLHCLRPGYLLNIYISFQKIFQLCSLQGYFSSILVL